jgi:uncharacterized membrane protein YfcA
VISLISLIGVVGAFHAGVRIEPVGWVFIGASIVGMLAGRRLCSVIPARTLQVGFASLCVLVAVGMLVNALL